jgi:uncharacterized protein YndB with AHSA1/START domain
MTEMAVQAEVKREITVRATPARAFDFFTRQMAKWWPATHHIAREPFQEIVMEPRAGGRWYELDANGTECMWGRVLAWEPPLRVVLGWHLTATWQFDPDPAHASEVEIRFEPVGDSATQVILTHSRFERHGEGYEAMMKGVGEPGGWLLILEAFGKNLPSK